MSTRTRATLKAFGLTTVVAFLAVLALGVASASVSPRVESSTPVFRNLRVCAYEAFSLAKKRCVRDQRATVLRSTRLVCSVDMVLSRRAKVTYAWRYKGQIVGVSHSTYRPGRRTILEKLDSGQPDGPVPGGGLRCTFAVGSTRVGATFTSGGPTGDIVNTSVCAGSHAIRYGGRFPICRADESGTPIVSPTSVVCNATYPLDKGRTAKIEILTSAGVSLTKPIVFTIAGPIGQGVYEVTNTRMFDVGDFLCRFSLDDQVVAEKTFQVTK